MHDDTMVAAKPQHVSVDLDGEAVVLDTDAGVYFGIDGVGARIWELIARPRRVGEVAATLVAEYDVEPEHCRADLERFLSDLHDQGLIDLTDAAGS